METELKLLIHPRHADAVRKHPLLKKYAIERASERLMSDSYFDTPDLLLWRSKAGLRVRHVGDTWLQTLKGGGSADGGLHQRHEWESRLDSSAPDLAALRALVDGHKPWARLLRSVAVQNALRPIFTVQIVRTVWQLQLPSGERVEFALDRGNVRSNGRQESIHEIELELKSGQAERLFEFALQLQPKIPMRIANISKAQRGYALSQSNPPSPPAAAKAARLKLSSHLSTEQAFLSIISNCIAQMQANEAGVTGGDDPECLHQLRVGLRRLRSALSLYKELFIAPRQMQEDIAWLSAQLGAARDWDVLAHATLPAMAAFAEEDMQIALLRSAASMQASQKHELAAAAVKSPRYARLMLSLSARAHGVAWSGFGPQADTQALRRPVQEFADEIVGQARGRLQKRARHVYQADLRAQMQALHRLRIAAKKMRYAAEFFQSLYPGKRVRPYVAALTGLQDALGQLNDAAIAVGLLKELLHAHAELGEAVNFARGYLAARTESAAAGLEELWEEFAAMKPLGKS